MSADGHQNRPKHACVNCKTRKKKCDKAVPSCNYCILKDLDCRYVPIPRRRVYTPSTDGSSHTEVHRRTTIGEATYVLGPTRIASQEPANDRNVFYRSLLPCLDGIHLEVQNVIRSTGEFVDDLTARYFRDFHTNLPIISRARFQSRLIATEGPPSPDYSVLLLTVCLISYLPNPHMPPRDDGSPVAGRQSFYLATKALVAQVQGSLQPSIALIQATLLLAMYEYANGRPEVALATIAGCARMAYAASIQNKRCYQTVGTSKLEVTEAVNTWWAIIIAERAFICETDTGDQPMATNLPPGDAILPIDRYIFDRLDILSQEAIPILPISCSATSDVGGYGLGAQASCLMDQVLKGLVVPDISTQLPLLESLDRALQSFLSAILTHVPNDLRCYCTALTVTVRALFKLHDYILGIPDQSISANLTSLDTWKQSSEAALDTITTMVIDMATWHYNNLPADGANNASTVQIYVVRASIKHVHVRAGGEGVPWPETAHNDLQRYLAKLQNQWVA